MIGKIVFQVDPEGNLMPIHVRLSEIAVEIVVK